MPAISCRIYGHCKYCEPQKLKKVLPLTNKTKTQTTLHSQICSIQSMLVVKDNLLQIIVNKLGFFLRKWNEFLKRWFKEANCTGFFSASQTLKYAVRGRCTQWTVTLTHVKKSLTAKQAEQKPQRFMYQQDFNVRTTLKVHLGTKQAITNWANKGIIQEKKGKLKACQNVFH